MLHKRSGNTTGTATTIAADTRQNPPPRLQTPGAPQKVLSNKEGKYESADNRATRQKYAEK